MKCLHLASPVENLSFLELILLFCGEEILLQQSLIAKASGFIFDSFFFLNIKVIGPGQNFYTI